jgi:thiol-disulfide isomerase/thioredoxin
MKNIMRILFILFVSISFISCSQKNNVEVDVPEIGNDTIFVENYKLSAFGDDPILDTIFAKNGKFSYNLKQNEPVISFMIPKKGIYNMKSYNGIYKPEEKSITVLLKPNDKISINGNLNDSYLKYEAKGSLINEEYSLFRSKYTKFLIEKSKIESKIDSLRANNASGTNFLFKKRKEKRSQIQNLQLAFIKSNLNKNLSAYFLVFQPLDTLGKYYDGLNKKVKEGDFKRILDAQLKSFKKYNNVKITQLNIKVGKIAPQFSLMNVNGEEIKVDYKNKKYTVLDFWGSWCAPCIAGFPRMKEYYSRYKNKIDFIGIACNDKEVRWKKAIQKYNLPWGNLLNSKNLAQDVSTKFAVTDYPTKIIVNVNGIIESIIVGEKKDFYEKLDQLFQN